jgi:hypothetical protein
MADSWQKFLYEDHGAYAVGPFTSESSVQLLDVLVKTKGSNPILYNVGSMVELGSTESQVTGDLREVLRCLRSNEDHELIERDDVETIQHTVKSRASLQSSLRIFDADAAKLDLGSDKNLECEVERLQITTVNREKLRGYIDFEDWKPNVDKLKKLKHWSEPSRGVPNIFGQRQAP